MGSNLLLMLGAGAALGDIDMIRLVFHIKTIIILLSIDIFIQIWKEALQNSKLE